MFTIEPSFMVFELHRNGGNTPSKVIVNVDNHVGAFVSSDTPDAPVVGTCVVGNF
jgi:hypothetical protein